MWCAVCGARGRPAARHLSRLPPRLLGARQRPCSTPCRAPTQPAHVTDKETPRPRGSAYRVYQLDQMTLLLLLLFDHMTLLLLLQPWCYPPVSRRAAPAVAARVQHAQLFWGAWADNLVAYRRARDIEASCTPCAPTSRLQRRQPALGARVARHGGLCVPCHGTSLRC